MSNLKPSPAPEGGRAPRDRRVSWGNFRVREYLRNDAVEEASSEEHSIAYLAPQDSFEGPLANSESSSERGELETPKSPAEKEVPRDQIMVTPIRAKRSPGIKPRSSLISRGKLTPMKSYGFSLRRLSNIHAAVPKTPLKLLLTDSKYSLEARQHLKDLESRLNQLRQDKVKLTSLLSVMQTQVHLYQSAAENKRAELRQRTVVDVRPEVMYGTKELLEQMKMVQAWERGYSTSTETVWHHSSTFYNWEYYSLFHLKVRTGGKAEVYVQGDWPEAEQRGVFQLLWERKQRLFQEAAERDSDVMGLAEDTVNDVILFMKDLMKVSTAFIVEDTKFTDIEMLTVVRGPTCSNTISTNLSTLQSDYSGRRGKMSLLLLP